jgi:hypothetical protein
MWERLLSDEYRSRAKELFDWLKFEQFPYLNNPCGKDPDNITNTHLATCDWLSLTFFSFKFRVRFQFAYVGSQDIKATAV